MKMLDLLPLWDWLALVWFFTAWAGYAWFARYYSAKKPSLLATTNRYRHYWLKEATYRDPRVLDGIITQNLSTTPAFFSSTTIILVGGLFALLGSTDKAAELVREVPFAVRTSVLVFDLKVLLLIGIFMYAFFRFSWSMRQYTFVALAIGSMPDPKDFASGKRDRDQYVTRASNLVGLAAETFNDGLRTYYFAFAAVCWFFAAWTFAIGTLMVVLVLYRREFRSDVLAVLND